MTSTSTVLAKNETGRGTLLVIMFLFTFPLAAPCQESQDKPQKLSQEYVLNATGALTRLHSMKQNMVDVNSRRLHGVEYNKELAVQSYEKIREAQLSAKSDGDKASAELLTSYARKLQAWGEKYKSARESLDASRTMGENEVREDPDLLSIEDCEKGLAAMLKGGSYSQDISSCR